MRLVLPAAAPVSAMLKPRVESKSQRFGSESNQTLQIKSVSFFCLSLIFSPHSLTATPLPPPLALDSLGFVFDVCRSVSFFVWCTFVF